MAREAGVSVATASRALSPGVRNVRASARDRIMAAADKLGYRPNLTAQATSKGTTRTIAVVVSDIEHPYYSAIAQGVIEGAGPAGLIVTIAGSGYGAEDDLAVVRALRGLSPQMIILTGGGHGASASQDKLTEELRLYEARGGRVVAVGQDDLPFDTVVLGHRSGAAQLAELLAERGYTHPLLLGPATESTNAAEWERGFIEAAKASGIDIRDSDIHRSPITRDGAHALISRLARHGLRDADLIVAASDVMAIGAMTALRESGMEPGEHIGLAGFGNVVGAEDVTPELTTVELNLAAAGAAAVQLGLEAGTRRLRHINAEPILRESTPPRLFAH
ncbi:LacI family DNA-binding transcriptional regulator [Pseudarthrobacter sp. NamE2]|uniref:LacI family DNA-binding transcriptional regulator n=1 Tax=Pseudarthrobacter sp. NamE2 TaxID=2576838 RepID=UPI001F115A6F|nr:LacI family DNA-binding transcriptional regulator [Pseudarthrobacter sp. NamE2]